jgi:transposase
MESERRQYTPEFKREAVQLSELGDKSAAQVARDLGITPKILYRWRAKLRSAGQGAFRGQGPTHPEDDLVQLRREVALLQQERDILKKALAIFSQSARAGDMRSSSASRRSLP